MLFFAESAAPAREPLVLTAAQASRQRARRASEARLARLDAERLLARLKGAMTGRGDGNIRSRRRF